MKKISISMAPPAGDRFLLRLTVAQHRRIRLAALISGESLSQFCRHAIRDLADTTLNYTLQCEREDDGRFRTEVTELPGVLAYGKTEDDAKANAEGLALQVLVQRTETS